MDKQHRLEQEQICLNAIHTIDLLRTYLYQIDKFDSYSIIKTLTKLRCNITDIYWDY